MNIFWKYKMQVKVAFTSFRGPTWLRERINTCMTYAEIKNCYSTTETLNFYHQSRGLLAVTAIYFLYLRD